MSANNETTTGSGSNSNACIVCYRNTEYYSIGMCEHPVCYECSTRMRVLCQQNECPICRQDLPKVVFTKEIKPFRFLRKGSLVDTRYNIYFESPEIQAKFVELLVHRCSVCENDQVFSSFNSLKEHMRRKHDLHYCELCVENLKIFSNERRCYTKQELSRHRRKGDVDDKSHKGHPLCEFCDKRYMDNDELYRHLRRDHLFCHFCDADGLHQYYNSYDYLREHFRQEHFLCEEGGCADEQFTSVFRTDIDLKAHKSSVHGKQLGKAAAKQARTLELEFTLAPRGDLRNRRPGPMRPHDGNANFSRNHQEPTTPPEEPPMFVRQPLVDVQSTQEFPTLGNATPLCPITTSKPRNLTIRGTLRQGNYNENFPALGPESSSPSGSSGASAQTTKTLNFSVTSSLSQPTITSVRRPTGTSNLSIHVNHRPNGTVTTRVAGPNLRITPGPSRDLDFPALGRVDPPAQSSWTKVTVKPAVTPRREKVAPAPLAPSPPPVQSDKAFPSLSKTAKTKTPVTTTSWVQVSSTSIDTNNSSSSTTDATKGKAKKKKKQQQQQTSTSNGTASITESSSSARASKETPDNNKASSAKTSKESEPSKKDRSKTKQNSDKSKREETSPESVTTASSTPRKRTELKIESLNNTINDNNNISVDAKTAATPKPDEFPALGRRPPPGLTSPPPGFGPSPAVNISTPPPGFFKRANGLTFTNSSGESYAILSDSERRYEYLPPADFQRRNQKLIAEFNNCFGSEESEELKAFRYLSGLFRTGVCDANEYYQQCRTLMGVEAFNRVFPELLTLLPDIDKQRKLFDVHKSESSGRTKNLDSCATCGQVLRSSDIPSHAASHSLENHFPALGKTSSIGSGWSRK